MIKKYPTSVRLSVPLSPETYKVFKRLSSATGESLGRSISEWLDSTSDAATSLAALFEAARQEPVRASASIVALMDDLANQSAAVLDNLGISRASLAGAATRDGQGRQAAQGEGGASLGAGVRPNTPPYSNTGGYSPTNGGGNP